MPLQKMRWVPNTQVVFKKYAERPGDYHGQMDGELFHKWFTDKLLANIPSNSMIIMDNATYHKTLTDDSLPTPACSEEEVRNLLKPNKISCRDHCLKVKLIRND